MVTCSFVIIKGIINVRFLKTVYLNNLRKVMGTFYKLLPGILNLNKCGIFYFIHNIILAAQNNLDMTCSLTISYYG